MAHFINQTRKNIHDERSRFYHRLLANPELTIFPSSTNYFLIKLPKYATAEIVCAEFAKERMLVHNCNNFISLTNRLIRIAINNPDVNRMIADKLITLTISDLNNSLAKS